MPGSEPTYPRLRQMPRCGPRCAMTRAMFVMPKLPLVGLPRRPTRRVDLNRDLVLALRQCTEPVAVLCFIEENYDRACGALQRSVTAMPRHRGMRRRAESGGSGWPASD